MPTNQPADNGLPSSLSTSPSEAAPPTPPTCPFADWPIVGAAMCAIYNAGATVGTIATTTPTSIGEAIAQAFIAFITLPFKLLGIKSPNDLLWRMLLLFIASMLLIVGLMVMGSAAVEEEQSNPQVQAGEKAAMMAA